MFVLITILLALQETFQEEMHWTRNMQHGVRPSGHLPLKGPYVEFDLD